MKKIFFPYGILLLLLACKDKLEVLDFFTVSTEIRFLALGRVQLEGVVDNLGASVPDTEGFVYSTSLDTVLQLPTFARRIDVQGGNATFVAPFSDFRQGERLYFRAFAASGKRLVYAENVVSYALGELVTMNGLADVTVSNDTLLAAGRLLGVQGSGGSVTAYGHVYSKSNTDPKLGAAGCLFNDLGGSFEDKPFNSVLAGVDFNTPYYLRAYALADGKPYYSAVTTVNVPGGWKRAADFPYDYQGGFGVEVNGKVYAGFGCTQSVACLQNELPPDFWRFDPSPGDWAAAAAFSNFGLRRTAPAAFSIHDTLYVVFGDYNDDNTGESILVRDFWHFVPPGKWEKVPEPSQTPRRTRAVSFVLNDKAYVGTGVTAFGAGGSWIASNDFWQYDPEKSSWRKVKSLPLKTSATAAELMAGRAEAVAFSIGGQGYVGGGINGGLHLRDFWKYTEPETDMPQDSGKWEFFGMFPGPGRINAAAFAIGDLGYYGTGLNTLLGYFDDFWSFNPAATDPDKVWQRLKPYPGGRRIETTGFAVQKEGYIGCGIERIVENNNFNLRDTLRHDFWRYTPTK